MLAARLQTFQISAQRHAPASGADAADLKVGYDLRKIAYAEIVQRQCAQHVVVVPGGNVFQVVVADLLGPFPAHVEGGVGRSPPELERVALECSAPPRPDQGLGAM